MSSESKRPFLKFPIDIRAHVLYDAYQRVSTEKSYKNYEKSCEALGEEAISIEEYESLFNQYLEEDERDLLIPDIRGCILSDIISGKTAEKSIEDLCDAFKYYKIDKENHDYWYNRFDSGHLFTRVVFSDFPEDVIAEIVEKCDIKSYLNLRNVSFGLRTVVDQLVPPCSAIKVTCRDTWINVTVGVSKKKNSSLPMEVIETRVLGVLEPLLRNPKLRLKYFEFYTYPGFWFEGSFSYTDAVIKLLNSFDHKIHVEKCSISTEKPEDLMDVLRCLKPGTLERMHISEGFERYDIDEIAQMDQWKQAKHLGLRMYKTSLPPMEHFLHFSTIDACFGSITLPDIVNLCDSVSKWTNFEHIKIENQARLDKEEVKRVLNLQPTVYSQIYSIPNSNLVIQSLNRINSESFKIFKN